MKPLLPIILVTALAIPAVSFAQVNNVPLTRSEVRAQLVTAEQQGLLHQPKTQYPSAARSVEKIRSANDTSGYGTGMAGSSQMAPMSMRKESSLFLHH